MKTTMCDDYLQHEKESLEDQLLELQAVLVTREALYESSYMEQQSELMRITEKLTRLKVEQEDLETLVKSRDEDLQKLKSELNKSKIEYSSALHNKEYVISEIVRNLQKSVENNNKLVRDARLKDHEFRLTNFQKNDVIYRLREEICDLKLQLLRPEFKMTIDHNRTFPFLENCSSCDKKALNCVSAQPEIRVQTLNDDEADANDRIQELKQVAADLSLENKAQAQQIVNKEVELDKLTERLRGSLETIQEHFATAKETDSIISMLQERLVREQKEKMEDFSELNKRCRTLERDMSSMRKEKNRLINTCDERLAEIKGLKDDISSKEKYIRSLKSRKLGTKFSQTDDIRFQPHCKGVDSRGLDIVTDHCECSTQTYDTDTDLIISLCASNVVHEAIYTASSQLKDELLENAFRMCSEVKAPTLDQQMSNCTQSDNLCFPNSDSMHSAVPYHYTSDTTQPPQPSCAESEVIKQYEDTIAVLRNQIDFMESKISDKEQMLKTATNMRAALLLSNSKLQQELLSRQSPPHTPEDTTVIKFEQKEQRIRALEQEVESLRNQLQPSEPSCYGQSSTENDRTGSNASNECGHKTSSLVNEIKLLKSTIKEKSDYIVMCEKEVSQLHKENDSNNRLMEQIVLERTRLHRDDIEGLNSYHEGQKSRELDKLRKELTDKMQAMQGEHEAFAAIQLQQRQELERMVSALQHQNEALKSEMNHFLLSADPSRTQFLQDQRVGATYHRMAGIGEKLPTALAHHHPHHHRHHPLMLPTQRTDSSRTQRPHLLQDSVALGLNFVGMTTGSRPLPAQDALGSHGRESDERTDSNSSLSTNSSSTLLVTSEPYEPRSSMSENSPSAARLHHQQKRHEHTRRAIRKEPEKFYAATSDTSDKVEGSGRWQTWSSTRSEEFAPKVGVFLSSEISPVCEKIAPTRTDGICETSKEVPLSANPIVTAQTETTAQQYADSSNQDSLSPVGTLSDTDALKLAATGNDNKKRRPGKHRHIKRRRSTDVHA